MISLILAGKVAMKQGPGMFNVAASNQYKMLDSTGQDRLKHLCVEDEVVMTEKAIKREGARIFRKVQSQVRMSLMLLYSM